MERGLSGRSGAGQLSGMAALVAGVGLFLFATVMAIGASPGKAATAKPLAPHGIIHSDAPVQTFQKNFNPFSSNSWAIGMYEPLEIANPVRNTIVPWLATGYSWSKSLTTLTFRIRSGVKWSDGHAFTPADVVFTFNMLRAHPALGASQVWTDGLASVTAAGKSVRFVFQKPFTPALYAILAVPIVPQHSWDGQNPETFLNPDPVATGPFTNVTIFQPQVFEIDRNPNYWQKGKPYVQGINVAATPSQDAQLLNLTTGRSDWNGIGIPNPKALYTDKSPDNLYWSPARKTWFLYLNDSEPPFNRAVVRKAISLAIDRRQFNQVHNGGYASPANGVGLQARAYKSWLDPKALKTGSTWMGFNVKKANQMLDAAGYPRGSDGIRRMPDGSPMSFNSPATDTFGISSVQQVSDNLKQIGINVNVQTMGLGPWITDLFTGKFDMMVGIQLGATAYGPTPFEFYQGVMSSASWAPVGTSSPLNYGRFKSNKVDRLLAQFAATADEKKQRAIMVQVERQFASQAPIIPIMGLPDNGEASTRNIVGWPSATDPYAPLNPAAGFSSLIVLTHVKPRS